MGDLGWTSCLNKQRVSCVRLLCKLTRMDQSRTVYDIWSWISRRRKGWNTEVNKMVNLLEIRNIVSDVSLSTKVVMKKVTEQVNILNNTEWQRELFNDRGKDNGNKLRTYRQYKSNCSVEPYVSKIIPRSYRRVMALFRAGSLPLAIETGRYTKPPIPVEDRLCVYCSDNSVETEKHFLLNCCLYNDLRFDLYSECSQHIHSFENLNDDLKFIQIMNCSEIQPFLCKSIHKFFMRRKLFT